MPSRRRWSASGIGSGRRWISCLLAAGLAACSAHVPPSGDTPTSPQAPGMIPGECESLLNKSREWGYVPGQKFQNPEKMLEVARFFATYPLVPAKTSELFRSVTSRSVRHSAEEDRHLATRISEAQVCDALFAQVFLNALLEFRWPEEQKSEAGKSLHLFLLNQQARDLPLLHRAITARAFVSAVNRGLVPGNGGKARALQSWMEKEIGSAPPTAEDVSAGQPLESLRRELILSNAIRERLAGLLPLP